MKIKKIVIVCFIIILIITCCIGFSIFRNETKTLENNSKKDYFVLYNGYEIEKKTGVQELSDMYISKENNKKYNIYYYNYEKGEYLGKQKGKFGEETFENVSIVRNVNTIATSQKYDAMPRTFSKTNGLPKKLDGIEDFSTLEIHSIDLDGNGTKENIICYTIDNKEEQKASSAIMIFDKKYQKSENLIILEDGFWAGIKEDNQKIFLSLEDIEYFDIDNDGIMEILINVPTYEGTKLSIIKYDNGKIDGEVNLKASLLP